MGREAGERDGQGKAVLSVGTWGADCSGCHPRLHPSWVWRRVVPTGQEGARLTPGALGGVGNERQRVPVQDQHAQGGEQDAEHSSHQPSVAFLLQKVGWAASQGRSEPDTRAGAPCPRHPLPHSWFIAFCPACLAAGRQRPWGPGCRARYLSSPGTPFQQLCWRRLRFTRKDKPTSTASCQKPDQGRSDKYTG